MTALETASTSTQRVRAELEAYDLRVDHVVEAVDIEMTPRFDWRMRSGTGQTPTAAHVVVVDENDGLAWDSGWIDAITGVSYAGDPLRPHTRYRWSVALRAADGGESRAASSVFTTAPRIDSARQTAWIGRAFGRTRDASPPQDDDLSLAVRYLDAPLYLRRVITLEREVRRARVWVTARGVYELRLNGARVGSDELAPGWTDYRDRILYQSHDITTALRPGENVIGAIVAGGWWSGYVGFDRRHQAEHYGSEPGLWLEAHIEYSDGTTEVIGTDGTWSEAEGEIRYADLLMGEYVDAREGLGAWDEPGYSAERWHPVRVQDTETSPLVGGAQVPVRPLERVPARELRPRGDGIVVDFGQNLVGKVRIDVSGMAAGERLMVRHGEMLDERGDVYVANLRTAEATDFFVSDGQTEVFEPRFTSHGFRFAQITGDVSSLTTQKLQAIAVRSDLPEIGDIKIAHAGLTQLLSNIRWGQRSNFVSVPTDCPQRDERLGWLADAQVFFRTAAYNADVAAFFRSWLRDVRYAQDANGAFPDVAPRLRLPQPGAPAWGDAGVILPWRLYEWYGDERFLTESWDSMVAWVDYVHRANPDLIWRRAVGNNFGDWLEVGAHTRRDVLATAYFAQSARLLARSARVLGRDDDAARYETLANRIRTAFCEAFVASDGTVAGDTQTGYLLALGFELVDGELREAVAERLAACVERTGTLTTGFVGVGLLLPCLHDIGRADLAWSLALREDYPSWLYSVAHGATTIWERWDGWTEHGGFQSAEMNSFNHYSLGSVGEWFYSHAAGIRQASGSVGFAHLDMRPSPHRGIGQLSARFESPRGLIRSAWTVEGDTLGWEVELPPATTASVVLPVDATAPVTQDGLELDAVPGVSAVTRTVDGVAFQLAPGSYRFVGRPGDIP